MCRNMQNMSGISIRPQRPKSFYDICQNLFHILTTNRHTLLFHFRLKTCMSAIDFFCFLLFISCVLILSYRFLFRFILYTQFCVQCNIYLICTLQPDWLQSARSRDLAQRQCGGLQRSHSSRRDEFRNALGKFKVGLGLEF